LSLVIASLVIASEAKQSYVIATEAKQSHVIAKPAGLKQSQGLRPRLGLASMLSQRRLRPTRSAPIALGIGLQDLGEIASQLRCSQ